MCLACTTLQSHNSVLPVTIGLSMCEAIKRFYALQMPSLTKKLYAYIVTFLKQMLQMCLEIYVQFVNETVYLLYCRLGQRKALAKNRGRHKDSMNSATSTTHRISEVQHLVYHLKNSRNRLYKNVRKWRSYARLAVKCSPANMRWLIT